MNNKIKTKLQFILGGILMGTFAVAGCNGNGDKTAVKDSTVTEMKTTVTMQTVKDSTDSMEKIPGNKSPTPQGN